MYFKKKNKLITLHQRKRFGKIIMIVNPQQSKWWKKKSKNKKSMKKKVKQIPANPGDEIENKYQDYGSNDKIKKN